MVMLAVLNTVALSLMDRHQVTKSLDTFDALSLTLMKPLPGLSTFEKPYLLFHQ